MVAPVTKANAREDVGSDSIDAAAKGRSFSGLGRISDVDVDTGWRLTSTVQETFDGLIVLTQVSRWIVTFFCGVAYWSTFHLPP